MSTNDTAEILNKPTHGRYPWENPKADPDTPIDYAKLMVTIKYTDGPVADFAYMVPSFVGKERERDIMIAGFESAIKKLYKEQWGV